MRFRWSVLILVVFAVSACALQDVPEPTPPPPITLPPPPVSITIEGVCDLTPSLEQWLQASTSYVAEFQTLVTDSADRPAHELFDTVLRMAQLRDAAKGLLAPDCTESIHRITIDTMDAAVAYFQGYANGELEHSSQTVVDLVGQFDRIVLGQNDLISRLDAQFAEERAP